ncbi:hypothetical protein [Fulvivirga sediminis]|uniref:Uncharacterized protein n=1 Tax=Fulvivirga sediminis TaxID=2803949 RepID=A0A937F311_9BACT|nr:hypothetical protein [Fulvivirga sediminis]MBL3655397.1 hypothetical protein [Fulvivirga sediminis]
MKLLQILALIIAGYIAGLFYPFWSMAILAFIIGFLFNLNGWVSFFSGFIAIFLLWGIHAFWIDYETSSQLTNKVAPLFSSNNYKLIFITATIGGLVGAFSTLSGTFFRNLFRKKRSNAYYQ